MEKREDRRVQRTRSLLFEALIDLIIRKGYEAVTVQDIIDEANVGRSTFYSHFRDKEQLLSENLAQLREFIKAQIELHTEKEPNAAKDEIRFEFSLPMLQHIQSHKRLYKAVAHKQSGIVVMHHLQRMFADLVRDEIGKIVLDTNSPIPPDIAVEFIVNTFFTLVSWWMEQSQLGSAETVDKLFHRLTLFGLRNLE